MATTHIEYVHGVGNSTVLAVDITVQTFCLRCQRECESHSHLLFITLSPANPSKVTFGNGH